MKLKTISHLVYFFFLLVNIQTYSLTSQLQSSQSKDDGNSTILPAVDSMVTVSGHVRYDNSDPISNAFIYFMGVTNSNGVSVRTNSTGYYELQVNQDSYYISAHVVYQSIDLHTFRQKFYNNKQSFSEADLIEINSDTDSINFSFPKLQPGSISGKVTDAATQQPVINTFIFGASSEPGDTMFAIRTNASGDYTLQLFEGDYIIHALHPSYYKQYYHNVYNSFDATPITVSSDNLHVINKDFELTKPEAGTNIISGFIRDKSVYIELPEAFVYAVPLNGGNWIEAKSGFDGKYVLKEIKNGQYILLVTKENFLNQYYNGYNESCFEWENAFVFDLKGNENITNIDLRLEPLNPVGGQISGKVYSDSTSSLSGTLISAVDSNGNVISSSISVFNGNYIIPALANGDYIIKASKFGYLSAEYSEKIQIDLINQPVVSDINFKIIITDIEQKKNIIPGFFALSQNYPNPFNPSTQINYSIKDAGNVIIKVFDVLGREVKELVNEFKSAGSYSIDFNAAGLSSGIYFYIMHINDYSEVRKMVLNK